MRDQVRERDNLKWPQRGGTKLLNAGTATFARDTGMVSFAENPNACPLTVPQRQSLALHFPTDLHMPFATHWGPFLFYLFDKPRVQYASSEIIQYKQSSLIIQVLQ
jgi:hypothetical protein